MERLQTVANCIEMHVDTTEYYKVVAEGFANSILFGSPNNFKCMKYMFYAASRYQAKIIDGDNIVCPVCEKPIQMNATHQVHNLDKHLLKKHANVNVVSIEQPMYLMMALSVAHTTQCINELLALNDNDEIEDDLLEMHWFPNTMKDLLADVEGKLDNTSDEFQRKFRKLHTSLTRFCNLPSMTNLSNVDRYKFIVNMRLFDECSSWLLFTRITRLLPNSHVFFQETHSFLRQALHGRIQKFNLDYPELQQFQQTIQFTHGKSAAYLLRGEQGHQKGKHRPHSAHEFIKNTNLSFQHPNTVAKLHPKPIVRNSPHKEEIMAALLLAQRIKISSISDPEKLQNYLVIKSTDGMQLKPSLRYFEREHCLIGFTEPLKMDWNQVNELRQMSHHEIEQYVRDKEMITEAQEFRIESIDGKASFPIGVYYKGSKGGSAVVQNMDEETQEMLETCQTCLENGDVCKVRCDDCLINRELCENCSESGHSTWNPLRRRCVKCIEGDMDCIRFTDLGFLGDCKSEQKSYMEEMANVLIEYGRVPMSDPAHDMKLVFKYFFWYWIVIDGKLVNLRLLQHLRQETDPQLSGPMIKATSRALFSSRDMMDVDKAIEMFRPSVKDAVPDVIITTTLIPERLRTWKQNAPDLLESPSGITFMAHHSMFFVSDDAKNTLYMGNMHTPVCVIEIKDNLNEPRGLTYIQERGPKYIQDFVLLCNTGSGSIVLIDVTEKVSRRRALLQFEDESDDDNDGCGPKKRKARMVELTMHTEEDNPNLVRPVCITTNIHHIKLSNAVFYILDVRLKKVFSLRNVDKDAGAANLCPEIDLRADVPMSMCQKTGQDVILAVGLKHKGIHFFKSTNGKLGPIYMFDSDTVEPLGMAFKGSNVILADGNKHEVLQLDPENENCSLIAGDVQGFKDGCKPRFNYPGAIAVFENNIFLCDTNNKAIRLITDATPFRKVVDIFYPFVHLFHLDKKAKYEDPTPMTAGRDIIKKVVSFLHDLELKAAARTRKTVTQGPDMVIGKLTREAFNLLNTSFEHLAEMLPQENLKETVFHAFSSLSEERHFSDMRTLVGYLSSPADVLVSPLIIWFLLDESIP